MKKLTSFFSHIPKVNFSTLIKETAFFSKFFLLVIVFLVFQVIKYLGSKRLLFFWAQPFRKPSAKIRSKLLQLFNTKVDGEISSLDLITLALRHLTAKKARTLITIGGMSIGFGSVIFLLSLGYGVQKLVISRVARLGEMKQVIVTVGQSSSLKINDSALEEFKKIEHVESVLPVASVVSKINYNNSVSDAIAYAVTKKFLDESAIQPVKGKVFEDTEFSPTSFNTDNLTGKVAGAQTERINTAQMKKQISQIEYAIFPNTWMPVYSEPSTEAEIIGYTMRTVGDQNAIEVWGKKYKSDSETIEGYDIFGNSYSPWIQDTFPLWKKEICSEQNFDCVQNTYVVIRSAGNQSLETGYIQEVNVSTTRYAIDFESDPELVEGEKISTIEFSLPQNVYQQIYTNSLNNTESATIFTKQENDEMVFTGELVFGESYYDENNWGSAGLNKNGKKLGYWIKAELPLWRKLDCQDCDNLYLKEVDPAGDQIIAASFIKANVAQIKNLEQPAIYLPEPGKVLGIATESAQTSSNSATLTEETEQTVITQDGNTLQKSLLADGTIDWVSISSNSAQASTQKRETIPFPSNSQKLAVVNSALLNVFNIPLEEAIGKTFTASFTLDEEFFDTPGYQAESQATEFTIIGVVPETKTPSYFVPFGDIKNLGIKNYSQVKVVVSRQEELKSVRQAIESLGYKTTSVVDTVGKINSLFDSIRFVLSLLGFVALGVAALGMFNTLTVSLLEKTREVGLMKAIGMKSNEIQRLFLAESIIMGLGGGFFGLLLGYASGQLLSLLFSVISVTKGLGYIQFVHIPLGLAISIITLSFFIGIATGLYPSRRATKISALNALRYE